MEFDFILKILEQELRMLDRLFILRGQKRGKTGLNSSLVMFLGR